MDDEQRPGAEAGDTRAPDPNEPKGRRRPADRSAGRFRDRVGDARRNVDDLLEEAEETTTEVHDRPKRR